MPQPIQNLSKNSDPDLNEGVSVTTGGALSLEISDYQLVNILNRRIAVAKSFWNSKLDLDKVRSKAEKYYLNDTIDESSLHPHQARYKDNRLLLGVESLLPMAVSQPAEPVVTEAGDNDVSRQKANDLQNLLRGLYDYLHIKGKLSKAIRHILMGKRIGVLKYRFDPTVGKLKDDGTRRGRVIVEVVQPDRLIIDAGASDAGTLPMVAEILDTTIEALIAKFPDKKEEIMQKYDIRSTMNSRLQDHVNYYEVWFEYYDKDYKKVDAVCWKLDDIILDKYKNPNWNYEEIGDLPDNSAKFATNFFEKPEPPYIVFNHINLGRYVYDDTALIDNAINLQDNLNKTWKQIVENGDRATGGTIFNGKLVDENDVSRLVNDPDEKLIVKGDVRAAATRLPYNALPNFVINEKFDLRNEIDNMFGANAPLRGEPSGQETLGQDVMSQRSNLGRMQTLSEAIEQGMDHLYKALVQMMVVYYDEPDIVRFKDSEGKTQALEINRDHIEDGIQVNVKAGSALPSDQFTKKNDAIKLADYLDPLSLAEGLGVPDPKEFARRKIMFQYNMEKYIEDYLGGMDSKLDAEAMTDMFALLAGQMPPVPDMPSKSYIATVQAFLKSNKFATTTDETVKGAIMSFAEAVLQKVQEALGEQQQDQAQQPAQVPPQEQPAPENAPESNDMIPPAPETPPAPPQEQPSAAQPVGGIMGLVQRLMKRK